jgi:uncharacterized RDD family membrane protein YckC
MPDPKRSTPAPRLLRLAAFGLDALLAVLVVLAVRLAGVVRGGGTIEPIATGVPFDADTLQLAALLLVLRDVPFGASPAKWLLCLRPSRLDGARLAFPRRLLRALFSFPPLAFLPARVERRLGWQVVSYVPGRPGLVFRTTLTASAAVVSILWTLETRRPSIGRADAETLAALVARGDPQLHATLGDPLTWEIRAVTSRTEQRRYDSQASFALRIRGSRAEEHTLVHAQRVDGAWMVSELTDIEIRSTRPDSPEMARR